MPKRDDTFLLYYLEDFAEYETDNCPSLFCLSPSTVQIILSALRFCVWPTRWRENRDDNDRKIAEGLWPDARKWGELAIQEVTYNMACDIEEGFNTLGQAIENASPKIALEHMAQAMMALARSQCCRGGLGDGTNNGIPTTWTDSDGITHPIYGDNPPITHDGETPPEGFETWADYLTNKCQVANLVFDGWLATMRNMSTFTVFNATALGSLLGLALAGIIAFPPAAIPVMIGLLLGLGSFVVMFSQIADNLEANRESIVCDLYQSETVEVMTAILADALDAAIGILQVTPGVGQMFKASALLLVNGDTLNQLMSGIAGVSYPDADCSACGQSQEVIQVQDTNWEWVDSGFTWGEEITFTPVVQPNGFYYSTIRLVNVPTDALPEDYVFTVTGIVYSNSGSCITYWNGDGAYHSNVMQGTTDLGWEFGCTNQVQPTFTGVFTKST